VVTRLNNVGGLFDLSSRKEERIRVTLLSLLRESTDPGSSGGEPERDSMEKDFHVTSTPKKTMELSMRFGIKRIDFLTSFW
jgi:hypothetical protein